MKYIINKKYLIKEMLIDFEYKNISKLYHVTEKNKINKILKIGLTPKTNSKISEHPERIYFLVKPLFHLKNVIYNSNPAKYFI
jgi:hypothetical protein